MVAWTLVFHILGLVFWLGSLLVVTRVLAVHAEAKSEETRSALARLEMKLLKGLAHPGAALMVITGALLVAQDPYYLRTVWLRLKLSMVVLLILLDLVVYFRTKALQAGKIVLRRAECMALHGAIALVFVVILILVLTKPFDLPHRGALGSRPAMRGPAAFLAQGISGASREAWRSLEQPRSPLL